MLLKKKEIELLRYRRQKGLLNELYLIYLQKLDKTQEDIDTVRLLKQKLYRF